MTAYPHHSTSRSSEGVGELVKVVTEINAKKLEQRGGLIDADWKQKQQNTFITITKVNNLNNILTFILEEQHALIKTCAGNLDAIFLIFV